MLEHCCFFFSVQFYWILFGENFIYVVSLLRDKILLQLLNLSAALYSAMKDKISTKSPKSNYYIDYFL